MTDAPDPEELFLQAVERVRAKTGSPEKGRGNLLDREPAAVGDVCRCRCTCGTEFLGQALWKADLTRERPVPRTCAPCVTKLADAVDGRHAREYPRIKRKGATTGFRDAAPLRVPFKDD